MPHRYNAGFGRTDVRSSTLYFMEFSANFAALPLRRTICRVPAALCAAGRPAVRQRRLPVDSKQRVFGSNAPAVMGGHVIEASCMMTSSPSINSASPGLPLPFAVSSTPNPG